MKEERSPRSTAALAVFLLFAAVLPGVTPAEASIPRGGVADSVLLLDVESAPGCFGLLGVETSRCEITYARNNPLRFVDRDGRENEVAWDAMNRSQIQATYGDAAVATYDTQRAVMGAAAIGLLAGGFAAAEWGPAILGFGQQVLSRFGDKVDEAAAETKATTALVRFERTMAFEARQVQEKFSQHKDVFGITANWSKAAGAAFESAIKTHVESANTLVIKGSFHRVGVTHFLNPRTGVNVIRDSAGKFLTVFRLNPDQFRNVLERGSL